MFWNSVDTHVHIRRESCLSVSDTLRFLIRGFKLVSSGDVSRVCSRKVSLLSCFGIPQNVASSL